MTITATITYGAEDSAIAYYRDRVLNDQLQDAVPASTRTAELTSVILQTPAAGTGYRTRHEEVNSTNTVLRFSDSALFDIVAPPTPQRTLNINHIGEGAGTTTPATGSTYAHGTVVPLTATAGSGSSFAGWSGNVTFDGSGNAQIVMNGDVTVTANFALLPPPSGSIFIAAFSNHSAAIVNTVNVTATNIVSGDGLIGIATWNHATGEVASIAVSGGESNMTPISGTYRFISGLAMAAFRLPAVATGGTKTITATWTGPFIDVALTVVQTRGLNAAHLVDGVGFTSANSASPAVSVATVADHDFMLGVLMATGGGSVPGAGFTGFSMPDHTASSAAVSGEYLNDAGLHGTVQVPFTLVPTTAVPWAVLGLAFRVAPVAADTTPPAVSILAPAAGATVSGTVTITVEATDASGIDSIVVLVDGAPI